MPDTAAGQNSKLIFAVLLGTALITMRPADYRAAAATPASLNPAETASALADETDRAAFRRWFTFLADAQFERRSADVTDCAALIRHAYREALRPHSPEWYRRSHLPLFAGFPDVRQPPAAVRDGAWLLFRVADRPARYAEFADAATLIRLNARFVARDPTAAEPGDLFYFRQEEADRADHLMVFVGESRFDPSRRDWIVYHTGPQGDDPGEVRKVSLADLQRHPSARWRPLGANRAFAGVFRLSILNRRSVEQ
jgi:uncharacterized protein YfaT (DUF1175 family)